MRDLRSFLGCLIQVHKYKIKGDLPCSFHLGSDFGYYPNGTHYYQRMKYISNMLLKGDHPELDDSEFILEDDKAK